MPSQTMRVTAGTKLQNRSWAISAPTPRMLLFGFALPVGAAAPSAQSNLPVDRKSGE